MTKEVKASEAEVELDEIVTEAKKPLVDVDREKYQTVRTASGSKSLNNGDDVANALQGMNVDELYEVATKFLGEDYREKYSNLNIGMQRMNLGNRIRGHVTKLNKTNASELAKVKEGEDAPVQVTGEKQLENAIAPVAEKVAERTAKEAEDKKAKDAANAEAAAKAKKEKDAKPKASSTKSEVKKPKAA